MLRCVHTTESSVRACESARVPLASVSISHAPLTTNARPMGQHRGPPQKSSYLHSPRIVGFQIKRHVGGATSFPPRPSPAECVAQIYWKYRARDYRGLPFYYRISTSPGNLYLPSGGKEITSKVHPYRLQVSCFSQKFQFLFGLGEKQFIYTLNH